MCGIVGFTNYNEVMSNNEVRNVIENMNNKMARRGPDEEGCYINKRIAMAHKRLIVIDPDGGKQPMSFNYQGNNYVITYNGQIYNSKELRTILLDNGFKFDGHSDTEVLLKAFVFYGFDVVKHLNGIFAFAIWNIKKEELFLARDHFGVKPLYYSIKNKEIIFSSEIKALFEFPSIYPIIDEQGISELFGIGPAHTPGVIPFKGIKELKPATYIVFNKNYMVEEKYWKLESKKHNDDFETTCQKVEHLLKDSIERQLISDVPICTFLSGGLDSSIITKYTVDYYQKKETYKLNTFSVDYKDNNKNFQKTDFQPNTDADYIDFISNKLGTNHRVVTIDTPELVNSLKDAVIARDMPGMADVDSSLLLFCKKVKKYATVAISGECADEIFAGYPWFFREDALNSQTFPWSLNLDNRQQLLNQSINKKIKLKDYVDIKYNESLDEVEFFGGDTIETIEKKRISYLTMNWFMQTLLDRTDRMAMYSGLEVRVPFCDYRIAEYLWNIPWEMKAYKGREKGLLRYIMKDKLPEMIVQRKKSPYPKTWNPNYLSKVKSILTDIMNDSQAPIKYILNSDEIWKLINTSGKDYTKPWFGQLMTGPQLIAYLIQVNIWLEIYKPQIEI
ncbi:MAG: asparagine synthase (glutamine-hydrolyzing) [Clostridia bacterium]|nr:asparagine synthase (glutamine-hydrolyzing) [Clostridia bacterium]